MGGRAKYSRTFAKTSAGILKHNPAGSTVQPMAPPGVKHKGCDPDEA